METFSVFKQCQQNDASDFPSLQRIRWYAFTGFWFM